MVLLIAVLAVLVAGVVGAVILVRNDDNSDSDEHDDAEPSADQASDDDELDDFTDPDGGYRLSIPAWWAATAIHGDVAGVGADVIPDDPRHAAAFQQVLDQLPRSIVFYGVAEDEIGRGRVATNMNINVVPGSGDPSADELAAEMRRGIEVFGGEPRHDVPFTMEAGPGVRIEFDYREIDTSGVMYGVVQDGKTWALTFGSSDISANTDLFDAVAASFDVVG